MRRGAQNSSRARSGADSRSRPRRRPVPRRGRRSRCRTQIRSGPARRESCVATGVAGSGVGVGRGGGSTHETRSASQRLVGWQEGVTRRLRGRCAEPGCPVLTNELRCASHARPGRHSGWGRARRAKLAVSPRCEMCGAPAVEVDHIVALADGGAEMDPANWQALCRRCHAAKTAAEA